MIVEVPRTSPEPKDPIKEFTNILDDNETENEGGSARSDRF
jgi:hypothetical protein